MSTTNTILNVTFLLTFPQTTYYDLLTPLHFIYSLVCPPDHIQYSCVYERENEKETELKIKEKKTNPILSLSRRTNKIDWGVGTGT